MNSVTVKPDPSFWAVVRLLLGAARQRAAGRRLRQRRLLQHSTGNGSDTVGRLGSMSIFFLMAVLNGGAAFVLQSAVSAGQRFEAEHQGKIVAGNGFVEAVRAIEAAQSESSKTQARRRLEDFYSSEARYRSEKIGGSKEDSEKFLREAVRTHDTNDFVTEDTAAPGLLKLASTGRFPAMLGSMVLVWWFVMLAFQGEGLELDI